MINAPTPKCRLSATAHQCLPLLIVCVTLASSSFGQTELLHDFNDGTLGEWQNVIDLTDGQPYGPTQISIVDGQLVMSTNGPAPSLETDPNSFICISWAPSLENAGFTNGYTRATISPGEGSIPGILMRENLEVGADYEFWRNTLDGTFFIGRFNSAADPAFELLASTDVGAVPYEDGEQWIMEAGVVGSELSLKYWRPGEAEPLSPQLIADDTVFPPFGDATVLSLAVQHLSPEPIVMSAAFDDVFFTVPEPSTLTFILYAVPLLVVLGRCLDRAEALDE